MREKIKNLRSTPRGNALYKLMRYGVFFIILFILLIVAGAKNGDKNLYTPVDSTHSSSNSQDNQVEDNLTYLEKQKKLFNGKYEFNYEIETEESIDFMGDYDAGKVEGFKETEDNLIRYSIEDGTVYKINLNEKEIYNDLYENLEESFFDFDSLFSLLNMTSSTIENTEENKIYNYKIEDTTYKVTTDKKSILKIEITKANDKYKFSFKY